MLNSCFTAPSNARRRSPSSTRIESAPTGTNFESRAFAALWRQRKKLRVAEIFRCHAARVDGYLETTKGEIILLEMKEMLSWGSTQAAGFQFLLGRALLKLKASRGIIVFERPASQWEQIKPHRAWGQLALEAAVVSTHIQIGALQVLPDQRLRSYSRDAP